MALKDRNFTETSAQNFCHFSTTTVLVSHHQFISLDLEVPQDPNSVILHYL